MGGAATIRDDDRALKGSLLCAPDVLVELTAGKGGDGYDILRGNVVTLL